MSAYICVYVCVCVVVYNQCLWNGGGSKSVSLQCSSQGRFSSSSLGRGHCAGEPKKIRLRLFCQGQGFFICHIIVIQGITRSEMQSNQVRSVDSAK